MPVSPLIPEPKRQFFDNNKNPASGFKLFIYEAGTTTKATTFSESDGLTPNANPIILNSRGEPGNGVYVGPGAYKVVFAPDTDTDPPTSPIWTRDNLFPLSSGGFLQQQTLTAIAGQMVFTFTTISYTPGINSLSIFINGLRQRLTVDYTETSTTSITMTYPLQAGDEVTGVVQVANGLAGTIDAANVSNGGNLNVIATGSTTARTLADRLGRQTNLTVTVPGDFATLQLAVNSLGGMKFSAGAKAIVNIQTGHKPASGILVENGDFSHIWIESTDAEVVVDSSWVTTVEFLKGINARMPVLNCLINGDSGGGNYRILNGYVARNASSGRVLSGKGVKNVRGTGCLAQEASYIDAKGADFSFASQTGAGAGITAWGSHIDAEGANVSSSAAAQSPSTTNGYGVQAAHGGIVNFRSGNANSCRRYGIRATDAAILDANLATATGCGINGVRAFEGSLISANGVDASGAGTAGFHVSNGSFINAVGTTGTYSQPINATTQNGIIFDDQRARDKLKFTQNATRSTTNASFEDVTGFTFGVKNGETWLMAGDIRLVGGSATTIELAVNGPTASSTLVRSIEQTATATAIKTATAYDTQFGTVTADTAQVRFESRFVFTADGTLAIRFRRSAGAASAQILSGSSIKAERDVT